jgi:GT2 family glycosyltransferase
MVSWRDKLDKSRTFCPCVTVAIPTRNRGDLIAETLQSIMQLDYPNLEIVIVDQSTNEDTKRAVLAVAGLDPRVRLESVSTVGASAARNHAAQVSTAEIVAYTDDDCIVTEKWLDAIVQSFSDPRIAAVYGRMTPYEADEDERNGMEVGFKPSLEGVVYSKRLPPWYIGHGGNMSFRRKDFLDAGGFDQFLGAGGRFGACEDPDIAYRFLVTGKKVAYVPGALAFHKHWKDWAAQFRMERHYGVGAGAQFAKYIRCGDRYGWYLLAAWIWQLGVRRIGAGIFKWHSVRVMQLGWCHIVYPWQGVWKSLRQPVDTKKMTYVDF